MRPRRRAPLLLLFVALVARSSTGCSSGDDASPGDEGGGLPAAGHGGAGQAGSSGQGGAAAQGGSSGQGGAGGCQACVPGETQACTGPAACKGGQACTSDGCGWSACNCGSGGFPPGSSGGAGSAGAASGASGAAGAGASGASGAQGGGAQGGGAQGGGAGAGGAAGSAGGEGGSSGGGAGGGAGSGGSGGGESALYCPTPNPGSPVTLGTGGSPGVTGGLLDLHLVQLVDNPPDLADWSVTTSITSIEFGADVHVEFSKQDGPGRWPDITPPGWDGPLQYTLGMAEYVDGAWVASAAIQFWYGLAASGGNVAEGYQVACNWYYDGRWGPLEKRQPAPGEMIGIFVAAGNLRGVKDGSQSPVKERSAVVLVPMPTASGAKYTF